MKTTRLLALAAALLLPAALHAQALPQPELDQLSTSGTVAADTASATDAPPAPAPADGAAAPTRNSKLETRNSPAPAPKLATSGTAAEDTVVLDVFNVTSQRDDGYLAGATTAGARVATALKDTPASISVFTPEFLNDIGAQSIDEMLNYGTNVEQDLDDDSDGGGSMDTRGPAANNAFRIRGLSASIAVDGAESGVPVDLYNVDRAEVSSGANSILFGMGSQGGTINFTTSNADLQRNTASATLVFRTWTSPVLHTISAPYRRLNYKYNVVLIPKVLGLRLTGVFQTGDQAGGWRRHMPGSTWRFNPSMTIKPWANTTIRLNYEKGKVENASSLRWNASDGISGFLYYVDPGAIDPNNVTQSTYANAANAMQILAADRNKYVQTGVGDFIMPGSNSTDRPPTFRLNDPVLVDKFGVPVSYNMNPTRNDPNAYVFVDNNGALYNTATAYRSNYIMRSTGRPNIGQYRLPESISSYAYNLLGPSGKRTNTFQQYRIGWSQRIGPVNLDINYNRNRTFSTAITNNANELPLSVDVNSFTGPAQYNGTIDNNEHNPFAGMLYLQTLWNIIKLNVNNQRFTIQGEYTLNLMKYGRHRLIGMTEYTDNEQYRVRMVERLIDDDQVVYSNLQRRHYAFPGDQDNYYAGDTTQQLSNILVNGHRLHSGFVTNNTRPAHVKRDIKSGMIALQDYFLNDRLVTTFGGRIDLARYRRETTDRALPTNPLVLNGSKTVNEWYLSGGWIRRPVSTPYTFSAGGVYHVSDRFSSFINYSTNRGAPYADGRTTLPRGDLPALSKGESTDFGIMFDIMGDNKWYLRFTRFSVKQLGNASINPSDDGYDVTDLAGGEGTGNSSLGADNLFNIMDALYFLTPTGQWASEGKSGASTGLGGVWPSSFTFKTGPGAGPMPQSQYAIGNTADDSGSVYPYGHPPIYTAATMDTGSQGYEIEFTAKPSRNLTFRFSFSYTASQRRDIMPEIFAFYNNPMQAPATYKEPGIEVGQMKNFRSRIDYWFYLAKGPNATGNGPVADGKWWMIDGTGTAGAVGQTYTLYDYIWNQLYGSGGVRANVNQVLFDKSNIMGRRPFKTSLVVRYTFNQGALKGLNLGGGFRYQSPNLMSDPLNRNVRANLDDPPSNAYTLYIDPAMYMGKYNTIKGNSLTFFNAFATYRFKLFGGRTNANVQLNVDNIFDQCKITLQNLTMDNIPRRVYVNSPRRIQLQVTFDF